jgi:aminoglycoside 3-N-acetyltransferase
VSTHRLLVSQLLDLGVRQGGVLEVHTSYSKVRPVEGGPAGLITVLRTALGEQGTLVMPSMSGDDTQPFSVTETPCPGMGVVADTFWRMPGVLRTDSPHGFSAAGPQAAMITRPQPIDVPHGPESPVGRVHDLDGQVLLLGVDHTSDTMIHLGEYLAGVRYRRPKWLTAVREGQLVRIEYLEIDHCCRRFALVDGWLEERSLQRRGMVGSAEARLCRARDVVAVVIEHLTADEAVFLHPIGVDAECDEARSSLPTP